MAILSTGPIENNAVSGGRPTKQVTIRLVSRAVADAVSVSVQGYVLSTTRTLYVSELISIAPNEAVTRNYFADVDAFEFEFGVSNERVGEVGISVWGKDASGQLVDAHRVVEHEKTVKDL
ncbi:hypothetical protein ABIE27_000295 [Paenibacillus sp. 4624]|jgi:hypothetical protein|uniref:Collagen n=1 Tax=Paenibacillus amylolyticus TaxID=1451 RepID=A0A5M9WMM6_PAEAM|nr:hypothetical protein [Paenibacillus amylolyticus]KAA8782824.1 hypothetical protein EC604_03060 [Paenibacillus amylolyticus]